jgi:hypothetical protein
MKSIIFAKLLGAQVSSSATEDFLIIILHMNSRWRRKDFYTYYRISWNNFFSKIQNGGFIQDGGNLGKIFQEL